MRQLSRCLGSRHCRCEKASALSPVGTRTCKPPGHIRPERLGKGILTSHHLVKRRRNLTPPWQLPDWRSTLGRKATFFPLRLSLRCRGKRTKTPNYLVVALSNRLLPSSYPIPTSSSKRTLTSIAMFQPTVGLFWKVRLLCLVASAVLKDATKPQGQTL